MELQSLTGIWILKHRDEVLSDDDIESEFEDGQEKFIPPDTEILYFPEDESIVFQLGIRKRTPQECIAKDPDMLYEQIYCFPGDFNFERKEIFIGDNATFEMKDNNRMHITQFDKDYVCQEIWERMTDVDPELKQFIIFGSENLE